METPISELLRDKYGIDLDKSELQKLISQQVEQEVLKRLPKTEREAMDKDDYYNQLPNNINSTKLGLKNIFSKEKIEQQINGVKQFFEDHSLTPQAIKENAKDLINWNTNNPTIEKLNNTFSKVRDIFTNEQNKVSNLEQNNDYSLSDRFENLSELMQEANETITKSNQVLELRDFTQSNRLQEINQRLDIANENNDNYNSSSFNQTINFKNVEETMSIYNYLKDTQTMIENSNPYERNHNTNNLQLEQFSLSAIQHIEKNVPMENLVESRLEHINNGLKNNLSENDVLKDFKQDINKLENNLQPHEKDTIQSAINHEYNDNQTILESYHVQENDVFQKISQNEQINQSTSETQCEIVDVNNNEVFLNINNEIYSVSVADEDYNKIKDNPNNFTFTYDNDSEKLTYQAIENETEVQQEKQNEHEESPSKAPEDRNLSSLDNQIPPLQEDESEMER
ncbi:TPA: hypothetical protein ACOF4E_002368 [Staphylococcus aureus]|jgi:hypothetical protein|uniref:hypothetical protein n=1 Tax=Staphylococcus epidermidis TaxID=1282 RepID=UPI000C17B650|nr:hypothetical protein [Staphylococcus epidermidis]HCY1035853.1 hypothetical protein [Staphylococcus aureus]MCG2135017.1 hypothetical protein [Staphylococcus epidermidis]PIH06329.1 hypothetical protein CTJ00_13205 [Staphylococcus epidermidis]HDC7602880.1 hypothetical protein [Staphylococcus aureus]HEP1288725.1 hypothetical protein [Staphylococcus aureus]